MKSDILTIVIANLKTYNFYIYVNKFQTVSVSWTQEWATDAQQMDTGNR